MLIVPACGNQSPAYMWMISAFDARSVPPFSSLIKVFGDDLPVLKDTADKIGKVVMAVPGRGDLRVQRVLGLPLLEVMPDRARLARYGMSADHVLEVVEASRVGRFAGKIFEGSRRFDLMLLLPPATLTPEAFDELLVGSSNGKVVA